MKKILVVVCAVAFCLGAASVDAQVPYVQPYFDELQTVSVLETCTSGLGTIYIVAHNWGMFMSAIEYQVNYAPQIVFIADLVDTDNILVIGQSPTGISLAWKNAPGVAFTSLRLQEVTVNYLCDGCDYQNVTVTVTKHPASDETMPNHLVRALDFNQNEFWGVGMTAVICPTVPVEETTWGGIKAQY